MWVQVCLQRQVKVSSATLVGIPVQGGQKQMCTDEKLWQDADKWADEALLQVNRSAC